MALSHIIGFDDFPFSRQDRGDISIVGTVFSGVRLEGVLRGKIRRDGANSALEIARLVSTSKFAPQVQLVMLQGVAMAGFNVVDAIWLHNTLEIPVLIVARRKPVMTGIRDALLTKVRGGKRKWALIEALGEMEACEKVYIQRVGLTLEEARDVLRRTTVYGHIPEPLRHAHLIAGGIATGQSRGRT
jgi:uncharacterized protein